jgi:signal-transduction protein with cAMP-binding, CBS, and nucleotidyltransferase domain
MKTSVIFQLWMGGNWWGWYPTAISKRFMGRQSFWSNRMGRRLHTVSSRKVEGIMQKKVITIEPNQKAHEAAAIMVKKKIGALPVVHKGKLKGIITATDILKAFVKLGSELESIDLKPLVHILKNLNADEQSKSRKK